MAHEIQPRRRGAAGRLPVGALVVAIALMVPGASAVAQDGEFDPMVCAGKTVNIALVAGERDEMGLLDKEAEIEAATGMNLEIATEALGDLIASNNQNLESPESAVDIMDVLGFTVAQTVGANLFEPLQPYLDDPSKTPADYDFADFPSGQLEYAGYFDIENGQFGGDTLYLIPGIHSGSVLLFYRQDLLDAAGVAVPTTWAEYLAAAEKLTTDDVAGSGMLGANDVSAFLVDWYTRFITMGGQLTSGDKNDGTLEIHLDSPEGIAALQNMIDLLPYSPEAVTAYGFTEALDAFSTGKVALWPAWATIAGALYGPDSGVADTVAVAAMPADDGNPRGIRGGWGLGIPKNLSQERKDCAWHALTYITSKDFEKYQVMNYQTDPNRTSTGSDPEITEALPYIPAAVDAIASAQILEIANIPETFEIAGAVAEQINLALVGNQDAATAMANAQATATEILKRGGHQAE
ncbi:MAG TPA: extracellular solute-binding protein [Candidatus Limnocylindrales bacterium]|nr:extracellular solute-binding protein [Candidatus Limnocylindrales bacterium]